MKIFSLGVLVKTFLAMILVFLVTFVAESAEQVGAAKIITNDITYVAVGNGALRAGESRLVYRGSCTPIRKNFKREYKFCVPNRYVEHDAETKALRLYGGEPYVKEEFRNSFICKCIGLLLIGLLVVISLLPEKPSHWWEHQY